MKLEEKIRDRRIVYLFRKRPEIAYELAILYYILARRKSSVIKVAEASMKSIYWLKKVGVMIPEYLEQLSPVGRLEEIERILVAKRAGLPVGG